MPQPQAMPMARSTASTTATTASAYSRTIVRVLRRARSCCWKKFNLERDFGRFALLGRLGRLQELRRTEAEGAGEEVVREGLALRVVFHHRIVERLARERHLVLGAGELLLQREHVLVRLQVRVGLGEREEAAERAAERA